MTESISDYRKSAIELMGRMIMLYHIHPEDVFTDKEIEAAWERIK